MSNIIGGIGAITILFAGLVAITQYDIKKIIAYSTCSQIGYMFFITSLPYGQPVDGSLYHLITHGFFKALLFISAGLIIHSFLLSSEQDIRKFGNLISYSPLFYLFFLIGTLAILGIPVFSGYYSKELIILHSLSLSPSSYLLLLIGSILSSIYSIRLLYYTFYNNNYSKSFYYSPHISFFYIFFILILLICSICIGRLSSSYFSSLELINLDLEYSLSSSYYSLLPLFSPFFLFFLSFFSFPSFLSYPLWSIYTTLFSIFNRRFFFDTLYNYIVVMPMLSVSYHLSFKFLDRGLLELLGPISFFRLLYLPSSSPSSRDYSFYFLYFFISLSLPPLLWLLF